MSVRRVLLLLLCAASLAAAGAAYVASYRFEAYATYVDRKTRGIQQIDELDPVLEERYTQQMIAEAAPSAAAPADSLADPRPPAAERISEAAYGRADSLDLFATGFDILFVFLVTLTATLWKAAAPRPDDMDSMIAKLAMNAQARRLGRADAGAQRLRPRKRE